jgi:hypothetical protein
MTWTLIYDVRHDPNIGAAAVCVIGGALLASLPVMGTVQVVRENARMLAKLLKLAMCSLFIALPVSCSIVASQEVQRDLKLRHCATWQCFQTVQGPVAFWHNEQMGRHSDYVFQVGAWDFVVPSGFRDCQIRDGDMVRVGFLPNSRLVGGTPFNDILRLELNRTCLR